MAQLLNLGNGLSAEDVFNLAAGGNERAKMIFRSVGTSLGTALANLINIFNFPLYLLGGGLLGAWDQFQPAMIQEVERRSFTFRSHPPRIERAILGADAGLYGAAYLPFQTASGGLPRH
jgi:glucokinase